MGSMKPCRPAGASGIHADHDVAMRHPTFGIGGLPVLILVGRAFENLRVIGDHLLPLHRIAFLVGEALGVNPVSQNHRILSIGDGAENIRAHDNPVIHCDWHIPLDAHSVPHFASHLDFRPLAHLAHLSSLLRARIFVANFL